jgi:hypothetical protein
MKTDDYRRDYAACCAALEHARYNYHTGNDAELRLAPIRDRYADLWTRRSIDELSRAREDSPRQFETERVALSALLRAAQLGYTEAQAAEVTNELMRCAAAARLHWNGASLAIDDVPDALAAEFDAARRRELSARWFDALHICNDLRAARLDVLSEAARDLGFTSYLHFLTNSAQENDDANASDEKFKRRGDGFSRTHRERLREKFIRMGGAPPARSFCTRIGLCR